MVPISLPAQPPTQQCCEVGGGTVLSWRKIISPDRGPECSKSEVLASSLPQHSGLISSFQRLLTAVKNELPALTPVAVKREASSE